MNLLAQELIEAFKEDAQQHRMRVGSKIQMPTVYRCYLDEEDFKNMVDIFPLIREETMKALDAIVERENQRIQFKQRWLRFVIPQWFTLFFKEAEEWRNLPTVATPVSGWQIVTPSFSPDVKHPVIRTAVEMAMPARSGVSNTVRYTTERHGGKALGSATQSYTSSSPEHENPLKSYAQLTYPSSQGPQTYHVRSDEIRIGRGGPNREVDLELAADKKISRLHCILRRDPNTQQFTLEDQSSDGTYLNGQRLGKGEATQIASQVTINLANVIDLKFEAVEGSLQ